LILGDHAGWYPSYESLKQSAPDLPATRALEAEWLAYETNLPAAIGALCRVLEADLPKESLPVCFSPALENIGKRADGSSLWASCVFRRLFGLEKIPLGRRNEKLIEIPLRLLERSLIRLLPTRKSAPYAAEMKKIKGFLDSGRLFSALECAEKLAEQFPQERRLWWNLGVMYSWAGAAEKAHRAMERYADPEESFDDLVDGYTVVQYACLVPWASVNSRRGIEIWIREDASAEQLPNQNRLLLISRPGVQQVTNIGSILRVVVCSDSIENLKLALAGKCDENLPQIVAAMTNLGSENGLCHFRTHFVREDQFDRVVVWVQETFGENLVRTATFERTDLYATEWAQPDALVPSRMRLSLSVVPFSLRFYEDFYRQVWANLPHPFLEGLSPREAIDHPRLRARVIAMVRLIERNLKWQFEEFSALFPEWNLPQPQKLRLNGKTVRQVPPIHLERLDGEELSERESTDLLKFLSKPLTGSLIPLAAPILRRFPHLLFGAAYSQGLVGKVYFDLPSYLSAEEHQQLLLALEPHEDSAVRKSLFAEISRMVWDGLHLHRSEFAERFRRLWRSRGGDPTFEVIVTEVLRKLGFMNPDGTLVEWLREYGTERVAPGALISEGEGERHDGVTTAERPSESLWLPEGVRDPEQKKLWIPGQS